MTSETNTASEPRKTTLVHTKTNSSTPKKRRKHFLYHQLEHDNKLEQLINYVILAQKRKKAINEAIF